MSEKQIAVAAFQGCLAAIFTLMFFFICVSYIEGFVKGLGWPNYALYLFMAFSGFIIVRIGRFLAGYGEK